MTFNFYLNVLCDKYCIIIICYPIPLILELSVQIKFAQLSFPWWLKGFILQSILDLENSRLHSLLNIHLVTCSAAFVCITYTLKNVDQDSSQDSNIMHSHCMNIASCECKPLTTDQIVNIPINTRNSRSFVIRTVLYKT